MSPDGIFDHMYRKALDASVSCVGLDNDVTVTTGLVVQWDSNGEPERIIGLL